MKTIIGTNHFSALKERKLARARKHDSASMFHPKSALLLPPQRRCLRTSPRREYVVLARDRKAVHRDVQALYAVGMLLLERRPKPGHGQVQVVTAAASRFQLVAEV